MDDGEDDETVLDSQEGEPLHLLSAPSLPATAAQAIAGSAAHVRAANAAIIHNSPFAKPGTSRARPASPYRFWYDHFPDEPYQSTNEVVPWIEAFVKYFDRVIKESVVGAARPARMADQTIVPDGWGGATSKATEWSVHDLQNKLMTQPVQMLSALGLAASEVLGTMLSRIDPTCSPHIIKKVVRLSHYEPITPLKELKANLMGRFISIRGTVVRVSSVKPIVLQMSFVCNNCNESQTLAISDGKYVVPTKCVKYGCKSRSFTPSRGANSETRTADWQKIRIQEKLPDEQVDSGRIPRTVECEVTDDLVDVVTPGDVVSLAGTVKVLSTEEGKRATTQMYYLYIDVNSMVKAASGSIDDIADQGDGNDPGFTKDFVQFSKKDLYGIQEVHEQGNGIFRLVVNSLCPAIFGHELVKAGLVLALFGGRRRAQETIRDIVMRSDPHVLVVGDPGLGKSQMLTAACKVAPRGVYVCGNATTTSGLTVTMCKDSDSGDTALEAGALVLGDQGICCIDEFDKITEYQALLEAMEQQSISIAKAGIVCNLPARTSILAAANPVGGHYNTTRRQTESLIILEISTHCTASTHHISKSKTVSENLRMNGALLSRFDLVFILLDRPDEAMDMFLSEHIMKISGARPGGAMGTGSVASVADVGTLLDRLRVGVDEELDPIPPSLLRKYIAYAKKYVHPRMSEGAAGVLQEFYLTLRRKHRSIDSTPITTRQLESMIRLAEARARAELREQVTEDDARDVIELMKFSLWETYEDEIGQMDFARSQHGTGMSKQAEPKRFVAELSQAARIRGTNRFSYDDLYQIAKDIGLKFDRFGDMIQSLNNHGYLLKKGPR
ncbi:MCM2/3/5 family-domain-containing protein [Polychytrium aggregatum]|uniref:MCM2/3/5 family-domain-containing protein n=1 Tax=Polychytrium aggregatum TaxID=110093 RepID=UPI0022FEBCE0|nr:MCM2/3/5 family-domain-containing protein [Polychytrium aggregatum]KAI9209157.1 MCM2/3/5 family-domain-containing protein [Polychytrium aggregatum]